MAATFALLLASVVGVVVAGSAALVAPATPFLAAAGIFSGITRVVSGAASDLIPGSARSDAQPDLDIIVQAALEAAPTSAASHAVLFAVDQLGVPYRWGGDGRADGGFDCSGLTRAAYAFAAVRIPRLAQAQFDAGPKLPPSDPVEPGDLVFFGSSTLNVTHVGLALGQGEMIDAPHSGAVVRIEHIWTGELVGATRPWM